MSEWITKKSDKEKINWITKKKKKDDSKFYGYTGPVKPSGYIQKKSNKSYAKTEIKSQKAYTNPYINKKVKKKKDKKSNN